MSLFTRQRGATALALAWSIVVGACASSSSPRPASTAHATVAPATTAAAALFPATIASAQGSLIIRSRPAAIVSLSPTATETLFAVGAGPQVIAVDDQSDYPGNVPKSQLSGYRPNVEAIAAKKPDLVVIADDSTGLSAGLAKVDIPVLVQPAAKTLDESYRQIEQMGAATGHRTEASTLVASMRTQIIQLTGSVSHRTPALRIYDELDQTLYSVTSSTFIGQLFKTMGADNVADPADKTGSGYPQLSDEYVVKANPDLIFLSDTRCCQQTAATVGARPGWSHIRAVRAGSVILIDDDIASRWGPRVVDLVRIIAHALTAALGPPAGG